ncbi:MAG: hypothetical protein ACFFEY_13555 [Candidatus Thorarchaeota archaeon]
MLVKNVDFLITFKCPSKCEHYSYKAGLECRVFIKPKKSSQNLMKLAKMYPLQSVWVLGGEKFLYFEFPLETPRTQIIIYL